MRKFLIMSHGRLAHGLKDTLGMFMGIREDVFYISAYVDDQSLTEQVEGFFSTVCDEDEIIIFTDLLGGSVNRKMIPYIERPNTHLISGYNYPLILEVLIQPQDKLFTTEDIENLINKSRNQMVYVNKYQPLITEEDEL